MENTVISYGLAERLGGLVRRCVLWAVLLSGVLAYQAAAAPIVLTQSPSSTVIAGGSLTMSVAVSGSGTLSYQWRKRGAATVSTFAGTGGEFSSPVDLAFDTSGNLYVADFTNQRIAKVTSGGTISTFSSGFNHPWGVTVDGSGNVYVGDSDGAMLYKVAPNGTAAALAGGPTTTFADGTGANTRFYYGPQSLVVDPSGIIYSCDGNNGRIRKTLPDGTTSTFAGTGTSATICANPRSIARDSAGNLYVSGNGACQIWKITPSGVSSVYAGSGTAGSADGLAASASFSVVSNMGLGLAVDALGNLYAADTGNNKIRKITPAGIVSTVAGTGTAGTSDAAALGATFNTPVAVAVDASGNLVVSDNGSSRIRKITFLATSISGATSATYTIPSASGTDAGDYDCIVTDSADAVSVASVPASLLVFTNAPASTSVISGGSVTLSTSAVGSGSLTYQWRKRGSGTVSTVAGNLSVGAADGNGTAATLHSPQGVVTDAFGNIYVGDTQNNKIRKITPAGDVTTLAGAGTSGSADAIGTAATFSNPAGVAVDSSGTVYVADPFNHKIRKITSAGVVTTFAGSGSAGSNNATGTAATFNNPLGVALDLSGNVYVADQGNNMIRKITAAGVVTTLAGSGSAGSNDATGTAATFTQPYGVAVDKGGTVYVADTNSNKIRKITPAGVVTTLAGAGAQGSADGTGNAASFNGPTSITIDLSGNLIVAEGTNNKIRKVTMAGVVTTLAGTGTYGGADGAAASATFANPHGVTVDLSGTIYVADRDAQEIRKITTSTPIGGASSVSYTLSGAAAGDAADYDVVVTDSATGISWASPAMTLGVVVSGSSAAIGGGSQLVSGGTNQTVSGNISGAGGFLLNSGSITLTGTNTYTGGTTVNGGSLTVYPGSLPGTGAVNVASGATLSFAGMTANLNLPNLVTAPGAQVLVSGTYNVSWSNGSTVPLTSDLQWDADAVTPGVQTGSGTWSVSVPSWINSNGFNQNWVNSGSAAAIFLNSGSGVVGGTVTISSGISTGLLRFGVGTNYNITGGGMSLSGAGGVVETYGNARIDSSLSGPNGLTKSGSGTLTVGAYSVVTGVTNVLGGVLVFENGADSDTFVIASGGTLELNTSVTDVDYRSYQATAFSGSGVLRKTGAYTAEWFQGAATFAFSPGALIDVQAGVFAGGLAANEVWTNNRATLQVAAGAVFDGIEADVRVDALLGGGTIKSGFGSGYANFTFGVANGSGTFSGVLTKAQAAGNFLKSGTGTQTLTGSSSYTGSTTVVGGTLRYLGGTHNIGGQFQIAGPVADGATVEISGGASVTLNGNGGDLVYFGMGSGNKGVLNMGIGGTLTLQGDLGDVWVIGRNGGSATVNQTGGSITMNLNNPAIDIILGGGNDGSIQAIYNLSGGILELGSRSLRIGYGTDGQAVSGTFNQTGGLANVGQVTLGLYWGYGIYNLSGGTLAVTGLGFGNNNSSEFHFNGGTLRAKNDLLVLTGNGFTSAIVDSGGGVIDTNGFNVNWVPQFVPGPNSTGGITKRGLGTLQLTGPVSVNGALTIEEGTLFAGAAALSTGTVNVSVGATLLFDNADGPMNLSGLTIFNAGQILLVNPSNAVTWSNGGAGGTAPTITNQPVLQTLLVGETISLSVTASGTSPFNYQWSLNGGAIGDATLSSYVLANAGTVNAGSYTVTVSNIAGSVTSDAVAVTVNMPVVASNVTFSQQNGTGLVDVYYDLTGGSSSIAMAVSLDGGTTYQSVASLTGAIGAGVTAGTSKHILWNAGADYPNAATSNAKVRVTPQLAGAGGVFAPISGGTFLMGNLIGDGDITDAGTVSVTLSPYSMSVNDTTKEQWDVVRTWGLNNSYTDLAAGAGKASNHPVQTVSWYAVVKWANAASEKEGLTPCYTLADGGDVYRIGDRDDVICNWTANGYRLPTEAEWEIAARGGLTGKRFPLGDTLSQSQANYSANSFYSYDSSGAVNNSHPTYTDGVVPYTSPVGSFGANGYGLYDMAGNVFQWCWDWYATYVAESDPRGAGSGSYRVLRGGNWGNGAYNARCAQRDVNNPGIANGYSGFRLARGLSSGTGIASASGSVNTAVPTITTQTVGGSVTTGGSFTLSVVASGTGALGYQWSFNGGTISGATLSSYSIVNAGTASAGNYNVTVSNIAGNVTSNAAAVSVVPGVSGVTFSQQNGTGLVDVYYTLTGGSSSIALAVSLDGGTTFMSVSSLTGDVGTAVTGGTSKHIVWNAGTDLPGVGTSNVKVRVTPQLAGAGGVFVPIAGGTFQMGNLIGDGDITDAGTVSVTLSPYSMSVNDTTKAQWDTVAVWGGSNGYTDLAVGAGKASNHPVQQISWYDSVKWANAASEMDGLTPCYTLGVLFTESFSGLNGGAFNGGQYQSGLDLNVGGNLPGWSKSGGNAIHAVDRANQNGSIVNPRNFAAMIWQDNVIELASGISGSNGGGQVYTWSYKASPCVYGAGGQETAAGDGLRFEVLRADNSVLASHVYRPGAWAGNIVMVPDSFQYTGDGSGDIRIRISPETPNQGRFVGAVDELVLAGAASVYRTGTVDSVICDWTANGYRLPTEAEWEIAARGGLSGKRFPLGDTLSQSQANYQSGPDSYDLSGPSVAYHPAYATGGTPYSSPVGSFVANGYGLNDMAGNVSQWCWDWYGASYAGGSDPRGPGSGTVRIWRAGNWGGFASDARCARRYVDAPLLAHPYIGFRLARGLSSGTGVASASGSVNTVLPTITSQPFGGTLTTGGSLTLSVGASGTGTFGYQWSLNGGTISGATLSSYTLASAGTVNAGSYTVSVSNLAGSVTSNAAAVTVNAPPTISVQPAPQTLVSGGTISLNVVASGTAPIGYQWFLNGGTISGATLSSYVLASAGTINAGSYSVVVSNMAGSVSSGTVAVSVVPGVNGVTFAQQNGNGLVDVYYNLSGGSSKIALLVSVNGGSSFSAPVTSVTGDVGAAVSAGPSKHIVWNAATDLPGQSLENFKVRVVTVGPWNGIGAGGTFVPIASGTYQIGNVTGDGGYGNSAGVTSVTLSPYFMSVNSTTYAQWQTVYSWATTHGYGFDNAGSGKESNHPVQTVNWYDVVKWANAASEKEGLTPCYTVSGSVCRTGQSDVVVCDWSANGYRLPTEAEWEVAARGGLTGLRFPWGNMNSQSLANYVSNTYWQSIDLTASVNNYNPAYNDGTPPYTSPVGSFAPNGYGLFDMVGNIRQWMWNWYVEPYPGGTDPRGPSANTNLGRTFRGGGWNTDSTEVRIPGRNSGAPQSCDNSNGFRLARGASESALALADSAGGSLNSVPPTIVTQPVGGSVNSGGSFTLNVMASGTGTFGYQWSLNGGTISGATLSSYPITNAGMSNSGSYQVTVSNVAGSVTSDSAAVTLNVPPTISVQPAPQTLVSGGAFSLNVVASGTAPIGYQWFLNGGTISGATLSSYVLASAGTINAGSYNVVVSNVAGSVSSGTVGVVVNVPPTIITQPVGQILVSGGTISLGVTASGTAPLGYQWFFNGGTISGATLSSYVLASAGTVNAGSYSVNVSNVTGSVTSDAATVTVNVPPTIVTQPVSQTLVGGGTISLNVVASGTTPLNYQWMLNGGTISGAILSTYTLTNAGTSNAGNYTVAVSNVAGSVTSNAATVTVNVGPTILTQPLSQTLVGGGTLSLNVVASGTSPLNYQWLFNGGTISGATLSSYTLANAGTSNSGNYSVVVGNVVGNVTSNSAAVVVNSSLGFISQPTSQLFVLGGSMSLSVVATSQGPISYQWFKDGAVIPNATSAIYTKAGTTTADNGQYFVRISSEGVQLDSDVVTVQQGLPVIALTPAIGSTALAGGSSTFSVAVLNGAFLLQKNVPITYSWTKNGGALPLVTTATLSLSGLSTTDAGIYAVTVTAGTYGSASASSSLQVKDVTITGQPQSVSLLAGGTASFSVTASGGLDASLAPVALQYQWRKGGVNVSGTAATYTVPNVQDGDVGGYDVVVTGGSVSVISLSATLTVLKPVVIDTVLFAKQARAVNPGQPLSLQVLATGTQPLRYQWYKGTAPISGGTQGTYSVASAQLVDAGSYSVSVSNQVSEGVNSGTVQISVNQLPPSGSVGVAVNGGTVMSGTSASITPGASVVLLATVPNGTDTANLSYQWRRNGAPIASGTSNTQVLGTVASVEKEGFYDVILSNSVGSVTWTGVQLSLSDRPVTLDNDLSPLTVVSGTDVKWTGFVAGPSTQTLTYQWRKDGVLVSTGTSSTLSILSVGTANAGSYTVTGSNSFSSVTSRVAALTVLAPAKITLGGQPVGGVFNPGKSATFTVAATGGNLLYQWQRDGQSIAGATGATFTLNPVALTDDGAKLTVRVYNEDPLTHKVLSTDLSNPVTASVPTPVTIQSISPNTTQLVNAGTLLSFSVSAEGTVPLNYQWRLNGGSLSGAVSGTYQVAASVLSAGRYDVVVNNAANLPVVSSGVDVSLNVPVTITQQPSGRTVNSGSLVTLVVGATGTAPLSYQWRKDGVLLGDGSLSSYVITSMSEANEGSYDVVVNNPAGVAVTSNGAAVFLNNDITITRQPQSPVPVLLGVTAQLVSFDVVATGTGKSLRYQWRRNGQNIKDAISATYRISAVGLGDLGNYDVLVSSGASTVTSTPATLNVLAALGAVSVDPALGYPAVVSGGSVRLTALVTGGGSLSYQWYAGIAPVPGGIGATLDVVPTDALVAYNVQVSVVSGTATLGVVASPAVPVQRIAPVSVVTAPSNISVESGKSARFGVVAVGGGSLTYQWERSRGSVWEKVLGATGAELRFNAASLSDAGDYRVNVSNGRNTEVRVATLTVTEANVITKQPEPQTVNPGNTARFEVVASGVDLRYQWLRNGGQIDGATSSVLSVPSVETGGIYKVVVTHAFGTSTSDPVKLNVRVPVTIVRSPVGSLVAPGVPLTLAVSAKGSEPLSYQWRKDGSPVSGGTQLSYVIPSFGAADQGVYDVVVTNPVGALYSASATVILAEKVNITVQPPLKTVASPGSTVAFSVVAGGTPLNGSATLKYQWYKQKGVAIVPVSNGGRVSGADTATLTIAGVLAQASATDLGSVGSYYVAVTGQANTILSVSAELQVVSPPLITRDLVRAVVNASSAATFTVTAGGTGPFTYQWFERIGTTTAPVVGLESTVAGSGITAVLSVPIGETELRRGRFYSVVVRNDSGEVTSSEAKLIFNGQMKGGPAEDVLEPQRVQVVNAGSLFTVVSSGTIASEGTKLAYQWRKDGVNISGGTSSSYAIAAVSRLDAGLYELRTSVLVDVEGGGNDGAELSRSIEPGTLLVVNNGPLIDPMPLQVARPAQTVVFVPSVKVLLDGTLMAAPSSGVSYSWTKIGGTVRGGTVSATGSLTLPPVTMLDAGSYSLSAAYAGITGEAAVVQLKVAAAFNVNVSTTSGIQTPILSGGTLTGYGLDLGMRSHLVLNAEVSEDGAFTYQWRFNGANIVGATRTRLDVPSVLAAHAGRYEVVASGVSDRATSLPVTLSIHEALKITTQPVAKLVVNPGQPVQLSVGVNSASVTYQWFKGAGRASQLMSSGTSNVLLIPAAQKSDEGSYSVLVTGTNGQGRISSTATKVLVNDPVVITTQPVGPVAAVVPGVAVAFSVKATGTGPLSYQWTRDGLPIPGANADTFLLSAVTVNDAGNYRVVVSNPVSVDGVVSLPASLLVAVPVTLVREPGDAKFNVGDFPTSLLSVVVQGDGVLSYQWRRNGVEISGGTLAQLVPDKALTLYSSGLYDVVVRNVVNGVEVSRVVSRKATVQVSGAAPSDASTVLAEVWTANEGDTVSLPSYAISANWALAGSGTLNVSRTRGVADVANLTIRGVTAADAGVYVASVLSDKILNNGTLTGSSVRWTLNVIPIPVITAEPVDVVVLPGKIATVSAATQSVGATFQWYFQTDSTAPWVGVPGATAATYNVPAVTNKDAGYYRLEMTNTAGTVSSRSAKVTVLQPVAVQAGVWAGGTLSGSYRVVSGTLVSGVISGGSLLGGTMVASADPGSAVTLVANVTGDLNTNGNSFQWYKLTTSKVWTVVKDAVDSTLSLTNVQESADTYYRVRAFGQVNNAVDSAPIRLTVNDPVSFVAGQRSKLVSLAGGESTTLSVNALGYDVHYAWFKDGLRLTAPDAPTLAISNVSSLSAGTYGVVISNAFSNAGAVASSVSVPKPVPTSPLASDLFEVARVSVQLPPAVSGVSVVIGGAVMTGDTALVSGSQSFSLQATVAGNTTVPVTYQWRLNGGTLSGTGASGRLGTVPSAVTLTGITASAASAGLYDVVVSNVWGGVVSAPVNVVVDLPPVITRDPVGVFASDGSSASFRVEASGTGLSYEWFSRPTETGTWTTMGVFQPILARVGVSASENGTYYRAVVSKNLVGGVVSVPSAAAKLTVTTAGDISISAPSFTELVNGVALPGSTVGVSAQVTGSGTLSVQWRKDGVVLAGASGLVTSGGTASYTLLIGNDTGGAYDLMVSNGVNFAYSVPVALTVDPKIESLDGPSSVNPGDGVRFLVTVTSKSPLSYQWFKDGLAVVIGGTGGISGGTSNTLTLDSVSAVNAGLYRVEVRTANASAARETRLTVSGLAITSQPVGITIDELASGTLSVTATSATSYQWLKDGVAVTGGTSSSLVVNAAAPVDGVYAAAGVYQVEVSNSGGRILSDAVSVRVNPALRVTIDAPSDAAVGSSINLLATATGTGEVSYTWTKGGVVVANTSRLVISPVTLLDAGTYTVSVSNGGVPAQASAVLLVRNVPQILVAPASQSVASDKTAKLFVVARFSGPITYQWFLNGGSITGATSRQLSVTGNAESPSSAGDIYTVRVSSATDASAYVEASARLSKPGVSGSTSGADTVLGTITPASWWVYSVQATGRYTVGGGTSTSVRDTASDRVGYWVVERLTDGAGVERAGRSAWIWPPKSAPVALEWLASEQQAQEVLDTNRAEFSVVGSRGSGDTFVVSGRLEASGDASLSGAPEVMAGEYDVEKAEDVDLSWDSVETLSQPQLAARTPLSDSDTILRNATWETVKTNLKVKLATQLSEPDQAPSGD